MSRKAKVVKTNECCGLSTPRHVCLNCDKPKCIYEKGEPRVPIPKLNPDEKYVVKKTRIIIKNRRRVDDILDTKSEHEGKCFKTHMASETIYIRRGGTGG